VRTARAGWASSSAIVLRTLGSPPRNHHRLLSGPETTFTTFATRITYERFPSGLESTARLPFQTGNRPGGGPSHLCVMRWGSPWYTAPCWPESFCFRQPPRSRDQGSGTPSRRTPPATERLVAR
jgi:hypothetical protein